MAHQSMADGMDEFGPTRQIDDDSLRVLRAKSRTLDGTPPVGPAPARLPRSAVPPVEQPTRAQRRSARVAGALAGIAFGSVVALLLQPVPAPTRTGTDVRIVMTRPAPWVASPAALLQAAASREVAVSAQVVAVSEALVRARAAVSPAAAPPVSSPRARTIRHPATRRVAPKP